MDRDMKRLEKLISDLNEMGKKPFIGYGNPNADILIIGKECADDNKERQEKFYSHNFEQWEESLNGHGFSYRCGGEPYDFESGNFHPINPFYKLEKKKQTGKRETGRAPSTYYYYQRLVDKIRARSITDFMNRDEKYIDFFNDCFITELSDICRKNDRPVRLKK